jgi:hypothetical protein
MVPKNLNYCGQAIVQEDYAETVPVSQVFGQTSLKMRPPLAQIANAKVGADPWP